MKADNKGFTFVELLVVMAILTVCLTTAINMYSYLGKANANKIVETIQSQFNAVRTESMLYGGQIECVLTIKRTKDAQAYIQIYRQQYTTDSDGNIIWLTYEDMDGIEQPMYKTDPEHPSDHNYRIPDTVDEINLGSEINYAELKIGSSTTKMNYYSNKTSWNLRFSFKRSTGGFDKITYSVSGTHDSAYPSEYYNGSYVGRSSEFCSALGTGESYGILTIQTSSNQTARLKLYFVTGRIETY